MPIKSNIPEFCRDLQHRELKATCPTVWVSGNPRPTLIPVQNSSSLLSWDWPRARVSLPPVQKTSSLQKTSVANNQLKEQRKSSEPGLGTHLHLFLFCHKCHLVLPEGLILLLMQDHQQELHAHSKERARPHEQNHSALLEHISGWWQCFWQGKRCRSTPVDAVDSICQHQRFPCLWRIWLNKGPGNKPHEWFQIEAHISITCLFSPRVLYFTKLVTRVKCHRLSTTHAAQWFPHCLLLHLPKSSDSSRFPKATAFHVGMFLHL